MRVAETDLPGVFALEPSRVFEDPRGTLFEAYSSAALAAAGIDRRFVQVNQTTSRSGVVRGIHYQLGSGQAKLIRVVRGSIFDLAVDLRRGSPCFGRWTSALLTASNRRQLFIPEGFGHAFCALEECEVVYQLSSPYAPALERGVAWDDPQLGIGWPVTDPLLSLKDAKLPKLAALAAAELPWSMAEAPRWNETSLARS